MTTIQGKSSNTGFPSVDKPWLKHYSEEVIKGKLPECSIYEYMYENNKNYPHDTAINYFGKRISYRRLFESIDKTASALQALGVKEGEIVTVALPSIPEALYIVYALNKIGAVVFSYFDSQIWQAKSLIVERELRKRREIADRRPVVNFYVLVSNAMTLFQEVDKIKGSTNAAVIPFTFDEICDSTSNKDLREIFAKRFQQYLYENNMLGDTEAIEDDNLLFGDRGKIADLIVDRCQKRANSGIFGLRRSGKTSVLNASLRRLDKAGIKYIKIESRSELENLESWKTALFDIAKKIRCRCLSLDQQDNENREEFSRRLKLNSTESDYEKRPTACFVEDVKLYCRDEEAFVIAIDEIELITFNTAKTDTWKSIEAYCGFWGALRDCGCSLIVSGVNSTINELNAIKYNGEVGDNPMYMRIVSCSDFSDTYLPSFTDEQTLYMINTLGGFSNIGFSQVYHDINTAFGGQPYAIRQFCSYVFEKVKKYRKINEKYEVSEATISNLLNEFQESAEGKRLCEIILQHLTIFADEYDMLKKLALLPERNRIVDFSDVERIDHLQKYGLIYYDPVTEYVSFRLNTIYTYIRRQYSKSPSEMNNDERREYIQSKVAEYEKKLKTFICNYFIYNSGGDIKCRNIMKTYINSSARNKAVSVNQKADTHSDPNTCNIRDFFDHKKYIIYFSSLRKIIIDNWNLWGARFESVDIDKVKFDLYMKQLNAGRTDADHYDAEDLS